MYVLGIESTAHTLGLGLVKNGKVVYDISDRYIPPKGQGILPRLASDHHARVFPVLLQKLLRDNSISLSDLDYVSVAQGPGIGACLQTGVSAARFLSNRLGIPLIPVNHPFAHIKIVEYFSGLTNPLIVYLSGGNTQLIVEEKKNGKHTFRILGETSDIGIGNLFDVFARKAGIPEAHGSVLEKISKNGSYLPLPYSVKGMNLVFSGLLTAALNELKKGASLESVAYSLFETAFAMIGEVSERALHITGRDSIILCGGVAQNNRLKDMFSKIAEENKIKLGLAPDQYNRDNGAMIAYAGYLLRKNPSDPRKTKIRPNYRIEDVVFSQ